MAKDEDIYVKIGAFTAKKADFDVKLTSVGGAMEKAANEYFSKAKGFTTKQPKGTGWTGFEISGNTLSIKKEKRGSDDLIICWVSLVIKEIPGNKLLAGKTEGMGGTSETGDLAGDVEFAATTAVGEAAKMAVTQIRKALK